MIEKEYHSEKVYHSALRGVDMLPLTGVYGHIDDTRMHFVNEKLFVTVKERGNITFAHEDGRVLAQVFVDPHTMNGLHGDCLCTLCCGKILLFFPLYHFIDTYPDCDGEYDRWIAREAGFQRLEYDIASCAAQLTRVEKLG